MNLFTTSFNVAIILDTYFVFDTYFVAFGYSKVNHLGLVLVIGVVMVLYGRVAIEFKCT